MSEGKKYRFLFSVAMFSGNATYYKNLHEIVSGMDDIDPTWLPIEWSPREWFVRIPPVSLNWSVKGGLATWHRVRALERTGRRFDGALFHHQMLPIWLFEFRKRVPYVITTDATPVLHDRYARWYDKKLLITHPLIQSVKRLLTQSVFFDARYVLPFSDWVKRSLTDDYRVPEGQIAVVPPGINLSLWKSPSRPSQDGRSLRILFVGGQFLRKGGDIVLRAAAREEFRHHHFDLVTQSVPAAVPDNVTVHTTITSNSEAMLALYAKADIFVLPTRADFHSLVSLEAMAMELPVLTTDVGSMREIIEDGRSGFIVGVDDDEAFVQRLRALAGDEALRRRLGTRGREIVEKKFDLCRNIEKTVGFLKRAADEHAAGPHEGTRHRRGTR